MGEKFMKPCYICNSFGIKRKRQSNCNFRRSSSSTLDENIQSLSIPQPNESQQISFNDFEQIKFVGRGTSGRVFLVKEKATKKEYALKVLKKSRLIKLNQVKNVLSEKKIQQSLSHSFIVKLHYTFQDEEYVYFVMDYIQGGELFSYLQEAKYFSESVARFYLSEIYITLRHLHSKGVVYRDLKTENILLDENGHIKLADFGLAKEGISEYSLTNSFCGTGEYIPPEVIDHLDYGFGFDWWGFGIIMYEMIFGIPPFRDISLGCLFNQIKYTNPSYSHIDSRVKVSKDEIDLLKKLLNKNPSSRIAPEDIPFHPFFKGVNFALVNKKEVAPPITPASPEEEVNESLVNNSIISTKKKKKKKRMDTKNVFESFSYNFTNCN